MQRVVFYWVAVYLLFIPGGTHAAVLINEFVYDDGGSDDRGYVELYNNGAVPVSIGGWTLGGQDQVGANTTVAITAGTIINPGAFYVLGQTGVLNANQTIASLEDDAETLELRNAGVLVDAVLYESSRGPTSLNPFQGGHGALPADVLAQVGPGIWGLNQAADVPGSPLLSTVAVARFVDGRDTNNNGRDFGYRPNTPGTTNNPANITEYLLPDISSMAVGSGLAGFAQVFNPPRVIDPAIVDANNPNPIPPPPSSPNRALVAWDPAGGGNGVSSPETFATSESKFDLYAYLDTRDLPQMTNANNVAFRGSEISVFGIGSTDALSNLTDISGQVGVADTSNGTTGVAWLYEKVAAPNPNNPPGPGNLVSEMLYLVDAGDGGDAGQGGTRPFDWTILTAIDLSSMPSAWYRIGIDIDALGNGVARFENQLFNFTTGLHSGAFSVAYRENTQIGSDGTPDAYLRPPTFAAVPEPSTLALVTFGLIVLLAKRRHTP